jgi:hypothetical protein
LQQGEVHFILFASIHDVLKAEKALKGGTVDVEVVPVPRSLSSDCGVCIKSKAGAAALATFIEGMKDVRWFVCEAGEYRPFEP